MSHKIFTTLVKYVHSTYAALEVAFDRVKSEYESAKFVPIDLCKNVSKKSRRINFEYVRMGGDASTNEVLDEMSRRGLRPALYEELLAFARKYPDEQRKFPIIALGSVWSSNSGDCCVAGLHGDSSERCLDRGDIRLEWLDISRFLAVKK